MSNSAIVVCAGNSTRFAEDKMMLPLGGSTVCQQAVRAFATHPRISQVIVVAPADKQELYRALLPDCTVVKGGATRQRSVAAALAEVREAHVLVHDGARPNVSSTLIDRVIDALRTHPAVVPVVPLTDSLLGADGYCDRTLYRAVQTPQGFDTALLRRAFDAAPEGYTDEGSLVAQTVPVHYVDGDVVNRKITYPVDYYGARGDLVYGVGYDIHRLAERRRLVLAGVDIPYRLGLEGHSDADVCLHAAMDAMLSAVGLPDIGHHFPNTPEWKDADSRRMLAVVVDMLRSRGASVCALTLSVVAEAPRLAPYVDAMRRSVAQALHITEDKVGLTVTTNEGVPMRLGDLVTRDAIAAVAVATVQIAR